VTTVLDLLIIASALASAWFWYQASDRRLKRITEHEVLNRSDLNRVIAGINKMQALSARAAMATALAALFTALRFGVDAAG
jgi:hypothetical protein